MLNEPNVHSELMAGFGEAMQKAIAGKGTIEEMNAAINCFIEEMAARIAAREKNHPKAPD
jgi:hypothetical protein